MGIIPSPRRVASRAEKVQIDRRKRVYKRERKKAGDKTNKYTIWRSRIGSARFDRHRSYVDLFCVFRDEVAV